VEAQFASWKQKLALQTIFPVWQNWQTLGKHARAINVSGNLLPRFIKIDERKNSS